MHPQPRVRNKKAHERSHHGHTGTTRHSPRNGFTAYFALSPVTRLVDTVACASYRRLDTSIGASERHDLAVRFSIIRPARYCSPDAAASTASPSAFVTCARPSVGRDVEGYRSDLGQLASEISEFPKIVTRPSRHLRLRPDRILRNQLICLSNLLGRVV